MNRLILIGNGFDLAHGLETGYNDFIKWYLTNALTIAGKEFEYVDELLKVEKENRDLSQPIYIAGKVMTEAEFIDFFYKRGFAELMRNQEIKIQGQNWRSTFKVTIRSTLLENLLLKCGPTRWVDIENEFYTLLKVILLHEKRGNKEALLNDVNLSLTEIIKYLQIYLSGLPVPRKIDGYRLLMPEKIKKDEIMLPNRLLTDEEPKSLHILNFNYTTTPATYADDIIPEIYPTPVQLNYIHGQLNKTDNPVIFGFGDELDEHYKKIEQEETPGFFSYVKSFWYFKTGNYHKLIRFIDEDEFQVYVLGHSCGLSDRTMLNMIFEHVNCKSIKIFYHENEEGQNNFTGITQEIARHFTDKAAMRKKISPLNKSRAMLQSNS
ncbi:MAG: hypothetical protein EOO07_03330 [Chitinophagaceae bacterium]|nr:MAG: hypothetical protein EOO07_03330 [Chitinophagaceae bacterium]